MEGERSAEMDHILSIIWGRGEINEAVFNRWNQGFVFSTEDAIALTQHAGGPCSVIAPVQAHLFKNMLLKHPDNWRTLSGVQVDELLCESLAEILSRTVAAEDSPVRIVTHAAAELHTPTAAELHTPTAAVDEQTTSESTCCTAVGPESSQASPKRIRLSPDGFHAELSIIEVSCGEDLVKYFSENLSVFKCSSGVLLFLYSAIASKGCECVGVEMGDGEEAVIDSVHGHGSQCLTNLLITGRAVSHVWDDTKHAAGLALEGILMQPCVGFLTVLERLHYCTVGWNLKNPLHPVWLLASETHITVLFSDDVRVAAPASARQLACRQFERRDGEGAGFLTAEKLQQLMADCQLVAEPEYVQLMRGTLDPDQLGIILKQSFLDEFFPEQPAARTPDSFTLYHCNSLAKSNPDAKVRLRRGDACILETDVCGTSAGDYLLTCLQSKWPRVDVRWDGATPSIN